MADSVRVTVDRNSFEVDPGSEVQAVISVQNLSVAVGVFSIDVEGLDPSWYRLTSSSVSLFPGDRTSATLTLSPPRISGSLTGSYQFSVVVTSQKEDGGSASVPISLDVLPFYDMAVDIAPQRLAGKRGVHAVSVTNTGNAELRVTMSGRDPEALCRFSFEPERPTVQPGETLPVSVTVEGKRPLKGAPRAYQYTLSVSPLGGEAEPVTVAGSLEVPPRLPGWVLRVAVICLVAVAVIGVLLRLFVFKAQVPVAEFQIVPSRVSLTEGESTQLVAVARDKDGNELVGYKVSWSSKDPSVALVSASDGFVRAVRPGTAIVEASLADQSVEAVNASITVLPVAVSTDCIRYDPHKLRFGVSSDGRLVLTDGKSEVLRFAETDDQENAVTLARRHTARCFIGRGDAAVPGAGQIIEFWTGSSDIDTGQIRPADCTPYAPTEVQLRSTPDGGWLVTDGGILQLRLANQEDAQSALILASRHSRVCYISRAVDGGGSAEFLTQYWE